MPPVGGRRHADAGSRGGSAEDGERGVRVELDDNLDLAIGPEKGYTISLSFFMNRKKTDFHGVQISTLLNRADSRTGAQFSALANRTGGDLSSGQLAGFSNLSGGSVSHGQLAGLDNDADGDVERIGLDLSFSKALTRSVHQVPALRYAG